MSGGAAAAVRRPWGRRAALAAALAVALASGRGCGLPSPDGPENYWAGAAQIPAGGRAAR